MSKGQKKKHEQINKICEERFNNVIIVSPNELIKNTHDLFNAQYIRNRILPWKKEVVIFQTNREKLQRYDNGGCQKLKEDLATIEFIKKVFIKFGNKFNFNLSEFYYERHPYVKNVICLEHGLFDNRTDHFLNSKYGCPKCGRQEYGLAIRMNQEEFINKANKIHSNKYSYNKVNYIIGNETVIITCPKHGDFNQTPNKHLNGQGCPKCNNSIMENEIVKLLEKYNIKYINEAKQKILKWLGRQRLDFYLPDYHIAIECQGEQHFRPVSFGSRCGKKENYFKNVCERDQRKLNLCKEHNIKLLYYSNYKNIPENYMGQGCFNDLNKLLNEIKK